MPSQGRTHHLITAKKVSPLVRQLSVQQNQRVKGADLLIGVWLGPTDPQLKPGDCVFVCETQPDLYELLDLKWRPNTIWKASFGHDS